jgi:hypothetical protein
MSPATIFQIHLVLGYVPWLLCFGAYVWPRLKSMDPVEAQRAIATLHSFRFFGLVFIVPGVVGSGLPAGFATFAAYGDFATGLLAMLALLAVRSFCITRRPRTEAHLSRGRRWQAPHVPANSDKPATRAADRILTVPHGGC